MQELEDYQAAVPISEEDFVEWKQNKVTKRFFVDISEKYITLIQFIATKAREDYPEKVGSIRTLNQVLNYKPSEIADDNDEEKTT